MNLNMWLKFITVNLTSLKVTGQAGMLMKSPHNDKLLWWHMKWYTTCRNGDVLEEMLIMLPLTCRKNFFSLTLNYCKKIYSSQILQSFVYSMLLCTKLNNNGFLAWYCNVWDHTLEDLLYIHIKLCASNYYKIARW